MKIVVEIELYSFEITSTFYLLLSEWPKSLICVYIYIYIYIYIDIHFTLMNGLKLILILSECVLISFPTCGTILKEKSYVK